MAGMWKGETESQSGEVRSYSNVSWQRVAELVTDPMPRGRNLSGPVIPKSLWHLRPECRTDVSSNVYSDPADWIERRAPIRRQRSRLFLETVAGLLLH